MISFLQDFDAPEFSEAHPGPPAFDRQIKRIVVTCPSIMDVNPRLLIASLPAEGQLPPCLDSQRLIFNDEAIPEGAQIVHSGYCGSRIAVIVEMPARKASRHGP